MDLTIVKLVLILVCIQQSRELRTLLLPDDRYQVLLISYAVNIQIQIIISETLSV